MKPRLDFLSWAALAAALVVTASAEYALARACGFGQLVAAGVPCALDIYAVRALRARRDVLAVVVAMIGVNAASHLVTAGLLPVNVPLVVAVSSIAPLVMWRVHALREVSATGQPEPTDGQPDHLSEPAAVTVERAPVRPVVQVPRHVPHHLADKPHKALLPTPAAPVPEPGFRPEPEPSAADVLARQHKVKPDQIRTVAELLAVTPDLSGKAAGEAIDRGDRYGRRVLTAARELNGVRT